jgi:outer membrane protein assembly factor BamB
MELLMRGGRRIGAVLLLLVSAFSSRASAGLPDGSRDDSTGAGQPLQLLWTRRVGRAVVNPALVFSGRIVVASTEGKVQCLDAKSGEKVWSNSLKVPLSAAPVAAPDSGGQSIFLAYGDWPARLRKVDAKRGKTRWTQDLESPAQQLWTGDGRLWLLEKQGLVACRDAADGAESWRVRFGGWRPAGFLLRDSLLFVLAREDSLLALDARTGARHWGARLSGPFTAPPVLSDGEVVVLSVGGEMTRFDPGTGAVRGKEYRSEGQMVGPAAAGGRAVTVTTAGLVEGFGDNLAPWKRDLEDAVQVPPVVMGSGFLIATGMGALHALAGETGVDTWSVQVQGGFRVAPVVDGENIFLATDRGHVYAYVRSR